MSRDIAELAARVVPPDATAAAAAARRQHELTKPAGSLGRLESLSEWLCALQGQCPARPLVRRRLVLFAADHGVTSRGVSAYPAAVTRQMVSNFLAGGAAVNVLARNAGVGVRVVDVAVDADDLPPDVTRHKVGRGSRPIDSDAALTPQEAARAVRAGIAIAGEEIDAGADVLIPGDMGIGSTTVASAVVAAVTGAPVTEVIGRGTGIDDAALARKVDVVTAALHRSGAGDLPALDLVAQVGGADIAAMAGFLLCAAARRTPVVLDGVVSGAAALVAERLAPDARHWWVAGHRSTEPAHAAALAFLGLDPLLDLGLRLGEGTGALLALPLLDASIAALTEMATFADAHVSGKV